MASGTIGRWNNTTKHTCPLRLMLQVSHGFFTILPCNWEIGETETCSLLKMLVARQSFGVNISKIVFELTSFMWIVPSVIFSWIKWYLMLMCFVHLWKTLFEAIALVSSESLNISMGRSMLKESCCSNKESVYRVCLQHSVSTIYSASVDDKATIPYFCAAHAIVPPPRIKV